MYAAASDLHHTISLLIFDILNTILRCSYQRNNPTAAPNKSAREDTEEVNHVMLNHSLLDIIIII